MKNYIPKSPPAPSSPLFTHLYKFNGKKHVLNDQYLPKIDQVNNLNKNPYAKLLSSPVRIDRNARYLSVPNELLIKLSILKNTDEQMFIVPNIGLLNQKKNNSYAGNKSSLIKTINSKNLVKIIGLNVLNNSSSMTTVKDINWNNDNYRIINDLYLESLLKEFKTKSKIDNKYNLILFNDKKIEKFVIKDDNTFINLSKFDIKNDKFEELKSLVKDKVIIDSDEFKLTFLKFIAYNE